MFEIINDGGITSPKGFSAGATYAGLKIDPETLDLGILFSNLPAVAAATFTQNSVVSPSVTVSRKQLSNNLHRGIVVNSGCANCSVGSQGMLDAEEMLSLASSKLNVPSDDLFVASTGMIGVELPMALIRQNMGNIKITPKGGKDFAKSMMTTDSHHKERAVSFIHDGETVVIGGAAKGVGMIHPNMATMLCFIATDADVNKLFLQESLSDVVNDSFNMIDVDGDQSTNDSVIMLANAASETSQIDKNSASAEAFKEALSYVCVELAKELVKDGEGAKTLVEVSVEGATSKEDARKSSRSIASSLLVKAMVHGKDPNWGRIVMALGSTGIELEENKIDVFISNIHIVNQGVAIPYYKDAIVSAMGDREVHFKVNLNLGDHSAVAWGCDLTEDYVVFNSAYST